MIQLNINLKASVRNRIIVAEAEMAVLIIIILDLKLYLIFSPFLDENRKNIIRPIRLFIIMQEVFMWIRNYKTGSFSKVKKKILSFICTFFTSYSATFSQPEEIAQCDLT
jgi:hypothetical protein